MMKFDKDDKKEKKNRRVSNRSLNVNGSLARNRSFVGDRSLVGSRNLIDTRSLIGNRCLVGLLAFSIFMTSTIIAAKPGYAEPTEKQAIADSKDKIAANKEKVSAIKEEQDKVNDKIDELAKLKSDAAAYIAELDAAMAKLNAEIAQVNADITAKEAEIVATQAALEAAKAVEASQYSSMKLRIKYMYEKGDTSFIDMILEAKSWSDLLNKSEYIKKISEYDREKLDEYKETRQAVADQEAALEQEHADLLTLKEQTEAKQQSVQKLLDDKAAEIKVYNQKIAAAQAAADEQQSQINALNADTRKQEAAIASMEAEIKRKEEAARKAAEESGKTYSARTLSGGMTWPCPASSTISSTFGSRESPTEGASSYHQGIDIAAGTGSAVVAAASGEVVISTYSASAGNYIMISHGSGVYTVYMHMSSLRASEGQEVSKGQRIGSVGSTGYSTGPHLHFGIRKNGSYVDPLSYVG